ncbi:ISAzo13-like element transposase-related protein [Streptomyces tsukubensis]|uniref:ISAzo13-like element transposase-related protein n=1 Tax=Streptomyces tsukubensis TaxID=83656 RepID=UPI00117F4CD3|nr:hypothetical protein [Streptomyces tsukubensis]QFR94465.1 hypothetical protein GBW32_17205 [Streptomyces tsukubensis]
MVEGTEARLGKALMRLLPNLNEHQRRLALGAVAEGLGDGGIRTVASAARVAEATVSRGVRELSGSPLPPGRIRRRGAGRKPITAHDPGLVPALLSLMRGYAPDAAHQSVMEWTTLSLRELARMLTERDHPVGPDTVAALLRAEGFRIQPSADSTRRGSTRWREAQLSLGSRRVREFTDAGHPAIRVRTERGAEAVACAPDPGGRRSSDSALGPPQGADCPEGCEGRGTLRRRAPSGAGRITVPFDGAASAVLIANVVQHWWTEEGRSLHARSDRLVVVVEAGPIDTCPTTLRQALSDFAAAFGIEVSVCLLPPATLRWRALQHRLSCRVTAERENLPMAVEHVTLSTIGPVPADRAGARVLSAPPGTTAASPPPVHEPRGR